MTNFIRFENRLINLEAIVSIEFFPSSQPGAETVLRVDWIDAHSTYFKGDRAIQLWELLLQHTSGAIDTTTLLASIDTAQMLDCLGMHLAALSVASELIAHDFNGADPDTILTRLLKDGRKRYQQTPAGNLEHTIDRHLKLWEEADSDV